MKKILKLLLFIVLVVAILFAVRYKLTYNGKVLLVKADSEKGFYYEYYLYIPEGVGTEKIHTLLVCPNNTGTTSDDHDVHVQKVLKKMHSDKDSYPKRIAYELKVPMLMPVFDRPESNWQAYTHALDSDTLNITQGALTRIDLQLIAMIQDAKRVLEEKGVEVSDKVIMDGFSASANFTNRFAVLHPNVVRAVSTGGVNSMPIIPLETLNGVTLPYHVGIGGLEELAGLELNLDEYLKVDQYIYMGAEDENDTLPYDDAYNEDERRITEEVLGKTMNERWQTSKNIYESLKIPAEMVTYEGIGHTVTSDMIADIIHFYKKILTERK
ncbi:hypothetical protein ISU02_00355 [Fusibacter sp. Q10-2]|uniref:Alpha/beta hydrolase n=2 Tax=Fusibacter ferrireducens TaxID=2785058 RepID=A0ABR9ZM51_9FIRM|nr:hypothetical protein [Fusibacter ferrireducens]